jgi:hypothetical protein
LVTGLPSGHVRSGPSVTGLPSGQLRSGQVLATLFGLFGSGRYSGASYGQGSPTHTSPTNTRQQQQGSPEISYNISGNYGGAGNGSPGGVAYGGGYAGGTNPQMAQNCLAAPVTAVPIDQIRQTVHLTGDQQAALDGLSAASSQANDIVEAACPTKPTLSPVGRLDAAEKQDEAMVRAEQVLRSPLEKFYASLSDEQKAMLNTIGAPPQHSSSQAKDQRDNRGTDLKVGTRVKLRAGR